MRRLLASLSVAGLVALCLLAVVQPALSRDDGCSKRKRRAAVGAVLHHLKMKKEHLESRFGSDEYVDDLDFCDIAQNSGENDVTCENLDKVYRTIDGSCNNLRHPTWGRTFNALRRTLKPVYDDGVGDPRVNGKNGKPLPPVRKVSLRLFTPRESPSYVHNYLHMVFGQLLDHDLSKTPVTQNVQCVNGKDVTEEVKCGSTGCNRGGIENAACLPIPVAKDDEDFMGKTCLKFVRSEEALSDNCLHAWREQKNDITSYLDASHVYGSTDEQAKKLRENTGTGKLKVTRHPYGRKGILPRGNVTDCRGTSRVVQCFSAGDGRVNEHVGLTLLHVLFMREHNRIVERLQRINPHWHGETLYQEARRIVAALWQHIVYSEYLPITLGPKVMHSFRLNPAKNGYRDIYDEDVRADVANVFATAAFRFGHSQIDEFFQFSKHYNDFTEVEFTLVQNRPEKLYASSSVSGADEITLGMVQFPAQNVDRFFPKAVTAHLFTKKPPHGMGTDLPSLNMQRGREHGLPGYNAWRKKCNLPEVKDFHDLEQYIQDPFAATVLSRLYSSVDDVDLFAAGLLEKHVEGGMVGPTFACLIGDQFRRAMVGDRFWYETPEPGVSFTPEQLAEIKSYSLAKLICNTSDGVRRIQRYALLQPSSIALLDIDRKAMFETAPLYRGHNNERQPCSKLPDIDLSKWKDLF